MKLMSRSSFVRLSRLIQSPGDSDDFPCVVDNDSSYAFSISLGALLLYEFLVGVFMPCEGVIQSIYMPNDLGNGGSNTD